MIKILIDLIGAILGAYIVIFFFDAVLSKRECKRRLRAFGYILVAVGNTVLVALFPNSLMQLLTAFMLVFILSLFYETRVSMRFFLSAAASAIIISGEVLLGILLVFIPGIQVSQFQSNTESYALGILTTRLISLLIISIIKVIYKKTKQETDWQTNLLIMFMPIQSIFLCLIVYGYLADIHWLQGVPLGITAVVVSLLLVFIAVFLVTRLRKAMAYKTEYEVAQSRLEMQIKHYHKLHQSQSEIRGIRHEINNNLITISGLLKEGKVEEVIDRIDGIYNGVERSSEVVDSGFPPIDAVISAKIERARESGIHISHNIMFEGTVFVEQFDLAAVIASALDNAVEGILCSFGVVKTIVLRVASMDDYIVVIVENSTTGPINSDFQTTKQDKVNHGFGLAYMNSIASKYDGEVKPNFDAERMKFTLRVLMKNREKCEPE